ncbi:putative pentatricopeptide repeat-containing protein At5g08310, mitochondrial [Malania oleifera]|uniref:putative pentatricopeptide repeat-containing protein At5g08310, mitochondrial n=1 Tax=Malania oleifera TaxID=397392 RepID=UPI0025AE7BF1|nr:putative pentatricopeptide repeat-containing protein At5g08310, mitochondrial [Malania oleifera]
MKAHMAECNFRKPHLRSLRCFTRKPQRRLSEPSNGAAKIRKNPLFCRSNRAHQPTCAVSSLHLLSEASLFQHLRPLCTNSFNPPVASDTVKIIDELISIFTKRTFSPDNLELKNLGTRLTPNIVESVLKGLKSWEIAHVFFSWASNQYGYKHNCYTYNAMAAILSRVRQNAPLRLLATDMVNSRCSMTPGALGFLMRCLGSQGLVEEAIELFDEVKKMGLCFPNNYSYNCLLDAISKSNKVDLIEVRLKEMREMGWELDKYTLTPVLRAYCNGGKFGKALEVFNQIFERGWVDTHVLSILALSFSKWGEVDKAFELIESLEDHNVRLNEKTFFILIHGFVKGSRVDKALQLFDKMQKLGYVPDVSVYDVLIGALCKNKELEKALCLYSEMKKFGIHPDVGILTKLISSFPEAEMTRFLEERRQGLDAEDMTLLYNAVLICLVNNDSGEKAYHLLQATLGNKFQGDVEVSYLFKGKEVAHPDTTSFSIVINCLCETGRLDMALGLFRDMVRTGCKLNVLLYNNLINGLCNCDRLEESFELLREMKSSGFKPTQFTHNSIFGCLCRREDVEGALNLLREMRVCGHEPWIKYYTLLVKQLCEHGRVVEACNFIAKMGQEGFFPDIIGYSAVIDGFLKIQEVDRALELFRNLFASGYCADVVAYNILINGLCKAKRMSEAQDLLHEMLKKRVVPSVITYNLLIDGWCKNGDIERAILCLSRMIEEEKVPTVVTYTTLIDGLCNAGRPDDALNLWNEMGEKGCSPNRIAFIALIHGLCKCDRPDAALVYFHEMKQKGMRPDTFVYVGLINAFLCSLNTSSAFEILKEMIQEGSIPGPLDKNYMLLREAIIKMSQDARTTSNVKKLIAEGSIATISLSNIAS